MDDGEEGDANKMDESAQQELKSVQGKDGVADFLFGARVWIWMVIQSAR